MRKENKKNNCSLLSIRFTSVMRLVNNFRKFPHSFLFFPDKFVTRISSLNTHKLLSLFHNLAL